MKNEFKEDMDGLKKEKLKLQLEKRQVMNDMIKEIKEESKLEIRKLIAEKLKFSIRESKQIVK